MLNKLSEKLIGIRRQLHENPELSNEEYKTLDFVKAKLKEIGADFKEVPSGGILVFIEGEKSQSDRSILLRADLDALPIKEEAKNLACPRDVISKNEGVMHACGHDGHTAMLLGVAEILLANKDKFRGRAILAFERGEEATQNYRFLHAYLDKENIKIDTSFALHVSGDYDTGVFAIKPGLMNAAPIIFDIEIKGEAGHGARPYLANSPLDTFNAIYNRMLAMRVNNFDPFSPMTYSIGEVKMGDSANQIPDSLRFKGTARFYDRKNVGYRFYDEFRKMVEDTAKSFGTEAIFHHYMKPHFPIINEEDLSELLKNTIIDELGRDYVEEGIASMGSDTFSVYVAQWPGLYINFGIRNKDKGTGAALHSAFFDLDEDALIYGARGSAAYAMNFLNSDIKVRDGEFKGRFKDLLREEDRKEDEIEDIYKEISK